MMAQKNEQTILTQNNWLLPKKKEGVELKGAFAQLIRSRINRMSFINNDLIEQDDKFEAGKLVKIPYKNKAIDIIQRNEGQNHEKINKVVDLMRRQQLNKEHILHQRKKSEQAEAERQKAMKKSSSTHFRRNDDYLIPPVRTMTYS